MDRLPDDLDESFQFSHGFPPGFRAGLAGAPAPDEFRHQLAGGIVVHIPMARQHGLRADDAEGPPQRNQALANLHLTSPANAGAMWP